MLEVAREWVLKAENDLKTAVHVLELRELCPTDSVCFHAQQCVEKYVKAVLVLAGIDFPKTHDLERLIALAPKASRPSLSAAEQAILTEYATGARYPGWGEITLTEARKAVALARRVRREIRAVLPRKVLLRKRGRA
ncbi:MAG: HEPN domain-containing protein [Thermoanaerobaculia bacterium]